MILEKMKTGRPFDVLSFGEIMLRLSPPNNERIMRGDIFECGAIFLKKGPVAQN